jgi:hypothetical protein
VILLLRHVPPSWKREKFLIVIARRRGSYLWHICVEVAGRLLLELLLVSICVWCAKEILALV